MAHMFVIPPSAKAATSILVMGALALCAGARAHAQVPTPPSFTDSRPVPLVQRPGDAEAETRRKAEEAISRIEADAALKHRAEEEQRQRAAAAMELKRLAEEAQRRADAEADLKRRVDEANRLQTATEARRQADENAKGARASPANKQ